MLAPPRGAFSLPIANLRLSTMARRDGPPDTTRETLAASGRGFLLRPVCDVSDPC